jgi:hypothetical protein
MALPVMLRKLLENLLIDILRKKYGTSELSLYYDTTRRRFQDFSVLVENLRAKESEFHYITDRLGKSIKDINAYRELGNVSAHSIDVDTGQIMDDLDKKKEKANYLVQLLLSTRSKI